MITIKQLIWDDWNSKHIQKHQVSIAEVEQVCQFPLQVYQTYKNRLIVLGKTKYHRPLTVVLSPEPKGKYYVVTARDMSKPERRRFLK